MKKLSIKQILMNSAVPALFLIIIITLIEPSGFNGNYITEQVLTRLVRNTFLVLSLLLPIMAGMGINFALNLGAMAGQIGLIVVQGLGMGGTSGVLIAVVVAFPIAVFLGWFAGAVLNKAKGREMITSMMLAFFITGVYQLIILFVFGTPILPFNQNRSIILSKGYGVRNSMTLTTAGGFDNIGDKFITNILGSPLYIGDFKIPFATILLIILLCIFTVWFRKTKLGQDMRAVGQDMEVAATAGINVDKTRVIAVIISTVLASIGQIIYLQNVGTMNTYTGHDSAALYAAAALLIGGASVAKATIPNALLGTALFHGLFILMPPAMTTITGNSMIGEYSRTFISYGIVTLALVLHAWRKYQEREFERSHMRGGAQRDQLKKAAK